MKKNIFFVVLVVMMGMVIFPVMAENGDTWESWNVNTANITLKFENGASGEYTLGDDFVFYANTFCGSSAGVSGTRLLQIDAYRGANNQAIEGLQYKNGDNWNSISEFNTATTFQNDLKRYFRVRFTRNGVYTINFKFTASDNSMQVACATRYLLIQDGQYSISMSEPEYVEEETTTQEPTVDEDFKIVSKTLSLSSGISLVFKVNGNLFDNRYTQPKLVVVLDGFETVLTEYTVDGSGRYSYEFTKITPDKMNATVEATLHAYKDGKEYVSPVTEYSVATYCYNMLNKYGETAGYETLRTLLVDMLNYGVASQNYTGFDTDNPANKDLTSKQLSWGSGDLGQLTNVKDNQYETIDSPSVIWKTSGLALQEAVIVKMKFETESTDGLVMRVSDDYGSTWYIEPEDFEPVAGKDNQYYVSFKGFNVGRMSDCMYFTAYRNGSVASNTYRYSVESYVYAHHNDANTLGALVTAMMKYGNSARAYNS